MIRQKRDNLNNMVYSDRMDNEPEEGEIVDYYEIISSDEECMVRQRIEELEAKNKEIEQIAVISNSYANYSNIPFAYNNCWNKNYAHINQNQSIKRRCERSGDASSISSSNEYATTRRHKSRRSKHPKRKHNYRHFRNSGKQSGCRRKHSTRHFSNSTSSRHKRYKDENYCYEIYSDSSSSVKCYSDEDNIRYVSDEDDHLDRSNYIDRKTLRFAIGRSNQHSAGSKATLKQRLQNREQHKDCVPPNNFMRIENGDNTQIQTIEDSSDSLEEKELRLIALKSAIHKKHMQRQKRDAETAYSPSDFEDLYHSNQDNKNDEMDLVGDGEIQGIDNTSSPISSPKLLLSPPHCVEEIQCSENCMVNTKVVDMEIASSDSDIKPPKWLHITTLPSDNQWESANDIDFRNAFKYMKSEVDQQHSMNVQVPGIKFETKPPQDFVMNDNEEIPPNPPPFREENLTVQEMDIDCIDITAEEEPIKISTEEEEEEEEEEELALRALLLSQFQTSKIKREKKQRNTTTSESILKEAVRRFKLNTKESHITTEIKSEEFNSHHDKSLQIRKNCNIAKIETNPNEMKNPLQENLPLEKSNSHLPAIQPFKECIENTEVCIPQQCSELLLNNTLMEAKKKNTIKSEGQDFKASNQMIDECSELPAEEKHKNNGALSALPTLTGKSVDRKFQNKKINNNVLNSSQAILPTYSVLRSRKIIKPNKIINNVPADFPRKTFKKGQKSANSKIITSNSTNLLDPNQRFEAENNSSNDNRLSTRLITNIEQAKTICKVPNLIINLQGNSSSISSLSHSSYDSATEDNYDTSLKLIADYHDNDSPISLNLDHHNATYSPPSAATITHDKANMDEGKFEAKLNDFLKNIRSKVQQQNTAEQQLDVLAAVKKPRPLVNTNSEVNATPKAVRHLPQAAQAEYRRLVYRMQMLENRRKSLQNSKAFNQNNKIKNLKKTTNELRKKVLKNKNSIKNNEISNNNGNKANTDNLKDLNANGNSPQTSEQAANTAANTDLYEKSYKKIGSAIVNYLDDSLRLVENAKSAKINKLHLENRINTLKKEIDLLEKRRRLEQLKITTIHPNIRKTNTIITNLKHKRLQILKTLLKLNDNKFPPEFRNDNELKLQINEKSKQLLENITLVNSLQRHNIHKYIKVDKADKVENVRRNTDTNTSATRPGNNADVEEEDNLKDIQMENELGLSPECSNSKQTSDASSILTSSTMTLTTSSMSTSHASPENLTAADGVNASSMIAADNSDHGAKDADILKGITNITNSTNEMHSNDSANPPVEFDNANDGSYLTYISPLDHLKNTQSDLDPQAILCPFDLRGSCQDDSCCYLHLKPDAKQVKETNFH